MPHDLYKKRCRSRTFHFLLAPFLQACLKDGAVCDLPDDMRQRSSTYGQVPGPLAVSGSRGVACVPSGKQRAVVYDLVEDEDEPEVDESMDNEDE